MSQIKTVSTSSVVPNGISRRDFFGVGARLAAGAITALPFMLSGEVSAAPLQALTNFSNNRNGDPWVLVRKPGTEVRPLVIIFLGGGPNQKIFDPKPDAPAEFRALFGAIDTKTEGLKLSELLPKTARDVDQFRVIRCMEATRLDHAQGAAQSMTGNHRLVGSSPTDQQAEPVHDAGHIKLAEFYSRRTLGCVMLATRTYNTFGGLQPRHRYVTSYVECDLTNGHTYPPQLRAGGNPERARTVLDLRNAFERDTNPEIYGRQGRDVDEIYEATRFILGRNFANAFDSNVPDKVRAQVGYGPYPNAAIVAAKLIQEGAPLVFLSLDGWDTHGDELATLKENVTYRIDGREVTGRGLGFQLDDAINYLKDTIGDRAAIFAFGEFGRSPNHTQERGYSARGTNHGGVYSMLATGAGVSPGVTGETDRTGSRVISRERYSQGSALERALNAAGYMRVKVIGSGVLTSDPERFSTQDW